MSHPDCVLDRTFTRLLRLDVMPDGADEARIIEGIRVLTKQ